MNRKILQTKKNITGEARKVSFGEAFLFWLKLGFISFGGPAGQIAVMHNELVDRRRWLSEERFLHALNYCMLLPGPEATQLAIYIGWLMHRTLGGIVAGTLFILPSIFILLGLSYIYAAYGNVPAVAGVLAGLKPVIVAVVVEAVLKIGGKALKSRTHFAVAALAFLSIYFLHVPFPLIILSAAFTGLILNRYAPSVFKNAAQTETEQDNEELDGEHQVNAVLPLVIDDHAPPPPHTVPNRKRMYKTLAIGFMLWLLPFLIIGLFRGFESLHAREYGYFTQAAFLTFGGAYAVLAYVTQAVAGSFGWITKAQAVDGLALAETTPGPLIMVLQFIGFMAAWNNPENMNQTASAIIGALITTYVTFLPCFIFIFVGAPYIEILRGNRSLNGALSGVTAAVVGVILNLALIFGAAVIFPHGLRGDIEWLSAIISVASFTALYRFKINLLFVIFFGGLIGFMKLILFG